MTLEEAAAKTPTEEFDLDSEQYAVKFDYLLQQSNFIKCKSLTLHLSGGASTTRISRIGVRGDFDRSITPNIGASKSPTYEDLQAAIDAGLLTTEERHCFNSLPKKLAPLVAYSRTD